MEKKIKEILLKATVQKDSAGRFEIADQKAKPIISLWMISQDIEMMLACIERAIKVTTIKDLDTLITDGLWEKVIICYGKIFSNSEGGFSKIEAKNYFSSKRSNSLHENLIKIRNSYLAHRGYNDYEHCLMTMDIIQANGKIKFEFSFPSLKRIGYFKNKHKSIVGHLKHLQKKINKKLEKKLQNLEKHILSGLEENHNNY